MKRGNRFIITQDGWLHKQDNDKIFKTDTIETLLVQETGCKIPIAENQMQIVLLLLISERITKKCG